MSNMPFPRRTLSLLLSAPLLLGGSVAAVAAPPAAIVQPGPVLTVHQDNLWNLAGRIGYAGGSSRQQVMVAILRRNPDAFVQGNMHRLRSGFELQLPSVQEIAAESPARSEALVSSQLQALESGAATPRLPERSVPAGPGVGANADPTAAVRDTPSATSAPPAPAASAPNESAPQKAPPLEAAPATAPDTRSSTAASGTASPTAAQAPSPSREPTPAPAEGGGSGLNQWLPIALLVLLGGGAWWAWSKRQRRAQFEDAVISSFFDENGVRRPSRPKLVDVSQAAMEMARTVETLAAAGELVRSGQSVSGTLPSTDDPHHQAAIKLEIARASLEVNRVDAARSMLQSVQREGNTSQQLAAGDLLARLMPPAPPAADTASTPA
jgi:FimV-like protein